MAFSSNLVGIAAMAMAAFLWSTNIFFGKVLLEHVPPFTLSLFRQCVTTLFCVSILLMAPAGRQNAHGRMPLLVLIGLLGFAIPHTLIYLALQKTSAISISILNALVPAIVVSIGFIAFGLRPRFLMILGIVASTLGALLIVMNGIATGIGVGAGELLGIFAMISAASYTTMTGAFAKDVCGLLVAALGGAAGTLWLLPLAVYEIWSGATVQLDLSTIIGILYVGIFPSAIAMTFWSAAIRRLGAERTSQGVHLIPLFTTALAITFLGERLQLLHILAATLAIGGVYMTRPSRTSDPLLLNKGPDR